MIEKRLNSDGFVRPTLESELPSKQAEYRLRKQWKTASRRKNHNSIKIAVKELDHYLNQLIPLFRWSRSQDTYMALKLYCRGVILPTRRKTMSSIARRMNVNENVIQQFISDSPWDHHEVIMNSMKAMNNHLSSQDTIVVVDDTGQKKEGKKSPGVGRQYTGTLGKTDNCQVIVASIFAIPNESYNASANYWPADMELYIPEDWFVDQSRREEAGIPLDIEFRTKHQIALEQVQIIHDAKIPHRAICSDAGYGSDGGFRQDLREMIEPYTMAVQLSHLSVVPEYTPIILPEDTSDGERPRKYPHLPKGVKSETVEKIIKRIEESQWERVTWNEGTKGDLWGDFVRMRVRGCKGQRPTDEIGWLVLERTSKQELKAHICWGLDSLSLADLVGIIHLRWTVEQTFKQMKREVGIADFEGRKWLGWHHHVALAILTYCFLVLMRAICVDDNQHLPSLAQMRREFVRRFVRRCLELKFKLSSDEADKAIDDMPWILPD